VADTVPNIAGTDFYTIRQRIEGNNVADLGFGTVDAKTVTISFWVRSSVAGVYSCQLANELGAPNRVNYVADYTINAANTWEYKTITVPGAVVGTWDKTAGIGLCLGFGLGAGATYQITSGSWSTTRAEGSTTQTQWIANAGATFYLTGVQLEVGSKASAFERRPYGMELQLCQRYYEKSFNQSVAPANNTGDNRFGNVTSFAGVNISTVVPFKVAKRISGNATVYNPLNTTANTFSVFVNGSWVNTSAGNPAFNEFGINLEAQATGAATGSSYLISCHWAANAEL